MASGTPKVPLLQQNGSPLMNSPSGPQLRPQFRRQGSSFGGPGYVSPMAVMVVPNKIDYSVTKGGLRMWAVLFVFVFLCSSLYTLFSAKDLAELAVDIDGDGDLDLDGEIDDDADEVATQNRRSERDTMPSKENIGQSRIVDEIKRAHGTEEAVSDTADDEMDEEERSEEETLFASLRAKAEKRVRKHEKIVEKIAASDEDKEGVEAEAEVRAKPSRRKNRRKRIVEENEEEGEEEEEEEEEQEPDEKPSKARHRKKRRAAEAVESDNEKEVEEKPTKQKRGKKVQVKNAEGEETKGEEEQKEEHETEEDMQQASRTGEEKAEEADEEEKAVKAEEEESEAHEEEEEKEIASEKPKKKRHKGAIKTAAQRECKRKNCPPAYDHTPRMELLKQKPQGSLSHRNKRYELTKTEEEDLQDFDEFGDTLGDEEEDEGGDEDQTQEFESHEVAAVKKQRPAGRAAYKRHAITNRDDHRYRLQLDKADYLVEKHEYAKAFEIFNEVLRHNEDSPRAHFGKARALDIRSEIESDSSLLDQAINEYQEVLDCDDAPDALFRQAAYRLIDRARFRGSLHKVLIAQRSLIDRYPEDLQLQNDFGLTFLMMGRSDDAFKIFSDVLQINPENGVAQAYYGYILKLNGDLENGVLYMRKGLRAARHTIADPRFYYHFGDALVRLGRSEDAHKVYGIGAKIGLFLSPYQRSLYNFDGLTARPWWSVEQTTYTKHLRSIERQWTIIREEAVNVLEKSPQLFTAENEELTLGGQWSAYSLYRNGEWDRTNCLRTPKTCNILKDFQESSNSSKNQIKISLLTSGSRVWPHCGYSNCRLQAHLGLIVPSEARIRVADETRGWRTGRFIIFDDSFEHEMWFDGASANKYRLVLSLDLWHPEIDPLRRTNMGAYFT